MICLRVVMSLLHVVICQLYVTQLPYHTMQQDTETHFQKAGVQACRLVRAWLSHISLALTRVAILHGIGSGCGCGLECDV